MDIKNSLEIVLAIETLGVAGVEIAKDGIGWEDTEKVLALAGKHKVFTDAIEDAGMVIDEAKDIDAQEAVQFYMAFQKAVKNIKASKEV